MTTTTTTTTTLLLGSQQCPGTSSLAQLSIVNHGCTHTHTHTHATACPDMHWFLWPGTTWRSSIEYSTRCLFLSASTFYISFFSFLFHPPLSHYYDFSASNPLLLLPSQWLFSFCSFQVRLLLQFRRIFPKKLYSAFISMEASFFLLFFVIKIFRFWFRVKTLSGKLLLIDEIFNFQKVYFIFEWIFELQSGIFLNILMDWSLATCNWFCTCN